VQTNDQQPGTSPTALTIAAPVARKAEAKNDALPPDRQDAPAESVIATTRPALRADPQDTKLSKGIPVLDLATTAPVAATANPADAIAPQAAVSRLAAPKMLDVHKRKDGSMVVCTQGTTFFAHHHYDKKGVLQGGKGGGPLPMYVSVASSTPIVTDDGMAMVEVMLSMERCRHTKNGPVGVLLHEANPAQGIFVRNPKILWNGAPVNMCDPLVSFVNDKLGATHLSKVVFTVVKSVGNDFSGDKARQISWASGDGQAESESKKTKLEPYASAITKCLQSSNLFVELPKELVTVLTTLDHGVVEWGLDSGSTAAEIEAARHDAMEAFLVKGITSMIKRSAGPGEIPDAVHSLDKACAKLMKGAGRGLATQILKASTSLLPVETQEKLRALQRAEVSGAKDGIAGSRTEKRGLASGQGLSKGQRDKPVRAFSHDSAFSKDVDAPWKPTLNLLYQGIAFRNLPTSLQRLVESRLNGLKGIITSDRVDQNAMDCVDEWRQANPRDAKAIQYDIGLFTKELANGFWRPDLVEVLARSVKPPLSTTAGTGRNQPDGFRGTIPSSWTGAEE
jgi:hypothetical protein